MNDNFQDRKTTRLNEYDYSKKGAYFLTICTQDRKRILSRVVGTGVLDGPKIELTDHGKIADKYIKQLNDFYENISVDKYVIMPDHIHILLRVSKGASRTSPPTRQHSSVSRYVSTFKRFSNKEYGENIWQESFFDHIIRSNEDYEEHIKYIHENPMKWYYKDK